MTKINNKTAQKSMSVKTEKGQKTSNVKSTLIKMIDKINILLAELATKKMCKLLLAEIKERHPFKSWHC